MIYHLFLLVVLFTASECWELRVSENNVVKKISSNISLNCVYDGNDNGSPKLTEICQVRISKLNKTDQWDMVGGISSRDSKIENNFKTDVEATGHAGTLSNTFLKINFVTVTAETVGEFLCEIHGYSKNEEFIRIKTEPVVVSERELKQNDILNVIMEATKKGKNDSSNDQQKLGLLTELVNLLQKNEESIGQDVERNAKEIKSISKEHQETMSYVTKINTEFTKLATEILNLKEQMAKQKQAFDDTLTILQYDPNKVWPAGNYAMLKPDSGCPYSPTFDWVNGSFTITTDDHINNGDETSEPSHIAGKVLQYDGYFYFHHVVMESCVKTNKYGGPSWPVGSYCIQSYTGSGSEVPGFNFGYIQFDRHNTDSNDTVVNTWSYLSNEFTRIGFLCRQDGDASTPIVLPSKDPFYLYRYNGECQSVSGMEASTEWVYYDTMYAHDDYENSWHPDGGLEGVEIILCYYTPRM